MCSNMSAFFRTPGNRLSSNKVFPERAGLFCWFEPAACSDQVLEFKLCTALPGKSYYPLLICCSSRLLRSFLHKWGNRRHIDSPSLIRSHKTQRATWRLRTDPQMWEIKTVSICLGETCQFMEAGERDNYQRRRGRLSNAVLHHQTKKPPFSPSDQTWWRKKGFTLDVQIWRGRWRRVFLIWWKENL